MSNHPNRGRARGPAANPAPDEIRAWRRERDLTAAQAAALIYCGPRYWYACEAGERRMHPGLWELLRYKAHSLSP